jgi:uncharacterized membrane protein
MNAPSYRITTILALASLAVVGRLALVALPGISLSYLVVLVAGLAYGVRIGASVGLLSRLTTDLILTGLNPIFLPMALVEAIMGALAGLLGRIVNLGQRGPAPLYLSRVVLGAVGVLYTLTYSVLTDTLDVLFHAMLLRQAPAVVLLSLWVTRIASGILFNVPTLLVNVALFAAAVPPILHALRSAGLLPEPEPDPDPAEPVPVPRTDA